MKDHSAAQPLISVVVATFNHARYIREAVASALNQTYPRCEVIVVDDDSYDGTQALISKFGNSIKFLRTNRAGPSGCLNAGLLEASGEFIAIMSGDDFSSPERVAAQLELIDRTVSDIVFCVPDLVDGSSSKIADKEFPIFSERAIVPNVDVADLFYRGNYLCATSAFIRRSARVRLGIFNESLVQLSDLDYWLRALGSGMKLCVGGARVVSYRRHGANLSGDSATTGTCAELPYILDVFLKTATASEIRKHFSQWLPPAPLGNEPLTSFEQALLFFTHDDPSIKSLGLPLFNSAQRAGGLSAVLNLEPIGFLINSLGRPS